MSLRGKEFVAVDEQTIGTAVTRLLYKRGALPNGGQTRKRVLSRFLAVERLKKKNQMGKRREKIGERASLSSV